VTRADSPIRSIEWMGADRRAVVVKVAGDIDLGRSAEFQRALLELPAQRPERIVVDLSGVPYMDSSGVASLVKLLSRVRRSGVGLKLVGLTPRVRGVFEITRLDKVFDILPSGREALE